MPRVLVIDDSPTSQAIATRLIGEAYEVKSASSGREGLPLLFSGAFDLLLLDLLMPEMDGQTVLAEVRAWKASFPVVVITADIQDSTRTRLAELGVSAMVNKPLTREKLISAMEVALGLRLGAGQ